MPTRKLLWLPGREAVIKWANDKKLLQAYGIATERADDLKSLVSGTLWASKDDIRRIARDSNADKKTLDRDLRISAERNPRIVERMKGTNKSLFDVRDELLAEAGRLETEARDVWRDLHKCFVSRLRDGEISASGHFEPVGRGRVNISPEDWDFLELWPNARAAEPNELARLFWKQRDQPVSVCWLMFGGPRDRGRPGLSPADRTKIRNWISGALAENPGISRKKAYERAQEECNPAPPREPFFEIFHACRDTEVPDNAILPK